VLGVLPRLLSDKRRALAPEHGGSAGARAS
jgi:hypothetical protein